jgi:hypothetical protein
MAIGLRFEHGDFSTVNKQVVTISGTNKTKRDFVKFLMTENENVDNITTFTRYNPRYGTEINRKSLYRNLSVSAAMDMLQSNLESALKYYVTLQESRDNLSFEEIITNFSFIVFKNLYDPTKINFQIELNVASGETIPAQTFSQEIVG